MERQLESQQRPHVSPVGSAVDSWTKSAVKNVAGAGARMVGDEVGGAQSHVKNVCLKKGTATVTAAPIQIPGDTIPAILVRGKSRAESVPNVTGPSLHTQNIVTVK